jgi:hypothetical protein
VSLENNQQVKSDENQQANRKVDNSRRSFAKKSAAIAPIVLTLANRSAWAGTNICQSGFASYTTPGFVVSWLISRLLEASGETISVGEPILVRRIY